MWTKTMFQTFIGQVLCAGFSPEDRDLTLANLGITTDGHDIAFEKANGHKPTPKSATEEEFKNEVRVFCSTLLDLYGKGSMDNFLLLSLARNRKVVGEAAAMKLHEHDQLIADTIFHNLNEALHDLGDFRTFVEKRKAAFSPVMIKAIHDLLNK